MGVEESQRETGSFFESLHPGHRDYQVQAHTQVIVSLGLISQLNPRVISQLILKVISQLNLKVISHLNLLLQDKDMSL